ncbi:hypothetical protein N8296_02815 [Flavobacteriaceae bacterium]|nr:hypothetical protein [Flavobacteriaceae bacterium]
MYFLFSSCTYEEDCPMVYAPVCCPVGKQYDNDCIARNAGVTVFTDCGLNG